MNAESWRGVRLDAKLAVGHRQLFCKDDVLHVGPRSKNIAVNEGGIQLMDPHLAADRSLPDAIDLEPQPVIEVHYRDNAAEHQVRRKKCRSHVEVASNALGARSRPGQEYQYEEQSPHDEMAMCRHVALNRMRASNLRPAVQQL